MAMNIDYIGIDSNPKLLNNYKFLMVLLVEIEENRVTFGNDQIKELLGIYKFNNDILEISPSVKTYLGYFC